MAFFRRAGSGAVELDMHPAQDDLALRAACDAIRAGDSRPARDLLAGSRADFDRRARYVWVLGESVTDVRWAQMASNPSRAVGPVDTEATWVDRWHREDPTNPDAVVVRARSLIVRGWEVRGSDWASNVGEDAFEEFHRLLGMALPLCHEAARLAPADPTPWVHLLLLATALGADRDDFERCWAEVCARDPLNREAHNFRLMYLCRKWRGSHEEMFAFAREAARTAPEGSPLRVLPMQANAEWAMWEISREGRAALGKVFDTWRNGRDFHADLDLALHRWFAAQPGRHAMWYHDLNYLAYGLCRAERWSQAKPVFQAIGPYVEDLPWDWAPHDTAQEAFLADRKKALRAK